MNDTTTDRYDELEWFDTSEMTYVVSVVKSMCENAEILKKNVDSIRMKGKNGKEVYSRMFALVDDCYSLICEWIKIAPEAYVICLTNTEPKEDILGVQMVIEKGGVKEESKKVVLMNVKIENFRERDERGESPIAYIAGVMGRIVYLMLYHDIVLMKKQLPDKNLTMDILKEITERMSLETTKDMEKWI